MSKTNRIFKISVTIILSFMLLTCFMSASFASYESSYAEPYTLVRKGSSGTGVKWVQDMLNHSRI